jgi:hypothetical protein
MLTKRNICLWDVELLDLWHPRLSIYGICQLKVNLLVTSFQLELFSIIFYSDFQFSREKSTMKSWLKIDLVNYFSPKISTQRYTPKLLTCWLKCSKRILLNDCRLTRPLIINILQDKWILNTNRKVILKKWLTVLLPSNWKMFRIHLQIFQERRMKKSSILIQLAKKMREPSFNDYFTAFIST